MSADPDTPEPDGKDATEAPAPAQSTGRSSIAVGAGILLSRIAGFLREAALARFLGIGFAADAVRAAMRIPNLLQNLLGEGVLSAAFIPVYSRIVESEDEERAGEVAGAIAGILIAVTTAVTAVVVVFARPITAVMTPGFDGRTFDLTVTLVRIMTLGLGFLVMSAWCLGILNSHRRFFLPFVAPVLWNAAQIVVIVFVGLLGWTDSSIAVALAWALVVGGLLQLVVQLPAVLRLVPHLRLSLRSKERDVRDVLRRTGPALLGRGIVQISAFADVVLASMLVTGAVAALGYAQVLYVLPISLFAMSVAAAELPELSRESEAVRQIQLRLVIALRRIVFYVFFAAVMYVTVGDLIISVLFEGGEFTHDDTLLVWYILVGYSVAIVASSESRLLQNTLYARNDVVTPAEIAAVRLVVSVGLSIPLMFSLDRLVIVDGHISGWSDLPAFWPLPADVRSEAGTVHLGAVGIALASSFASLVEVALLRRRCSTELGWNPPIGRSVSRLVPVALLTGMESVALVIGLEAIPDILSLPFILVAAFVTWIAASHWLGLFEADEAMIPVRRAVERVREAYRPSSRGSGDQHDAGGGPSR
ncbi:MAG: hypothetical protein JJLCMIEE_00654 [Acidimicrobiales bacterium]|nr:MAG: murein biosynthesis integral membrane protein MurJ [Actinomycetota bacterium]MBV6507604.1 hypothetical protein [Acidimicrobiales bacterium]RIK07539.1 MAG: murein biosynthesis integral membrane protein MurJ [Acidobacteriota bacterium]